MTFFAIRVFVVLTISGGVLGHGEHGAGGQNNPLHDTKRTHDKDHIHEHLKDEIDMKQENMNDEDLQFHYFKLHDYDHNNKLDGIELMNAMTHYHDEEGDNKVQYTDEQMSGMIDQILQEDDLNNDGYIDYPEFVTSQKAGAE